MLALHLSLRCRAQTLGPPQPQVASDGSGLGAAWHLNEVEILDTARNRITVFPCGAWLDPSDMASLTQTLLPRGVDGALGNLLVYEVGAAQRACRSACVWEGGWSEVRGPRVGWGMEHGREREGFREGPDGVLALGPGRVP